MQATGILSGYAVYVRRARGCMFRRYDRMRPVASDVPPWREVSLRHRGPLGFSRSFQRPAVYGGGPLPFVFHLRRLAVMAARIQGGLGL